jgi:membrane fusion protein
LQIESEQDDEQVAESQVEQLVQQQHQLMGQLGELVGKIGQIPIDSAQKVNALQRNRLELQQQLAQNEIMKDDVVVAPCDGILSEVVVRPGQQIDDGAPLFSIVPSRSQFEARLLVTTDAIGFVKIGQKVAMHYFAFPYQKFGVQEGVVTGISKSVASEKTLASMNVNVSEDSGMYLVYVAVPSQTVRAYGKDEALSAGMGLDADILLDERRLYEWIFEPLYGLSKE